MSEVRHFPWTASPDTRHCWALWREDLPCPNRPCWRVQNSTNHGYSIMCDVHKEAFATDYPAAQVRYLSLEEDTP